MMPFAQSFLVLLGTIVGAAAGVLGALFTEAYKRHRDRQATARGLAASIEATLLISNRRDYTAYFGRMVREIDAGKQLKFDKLLIDSSIDPITMTMLERVGMLGGDLPGRVVFFMSVLTSIRIDLVRLGNGELDDNLAGAAFIIRQDLNLWAEFEPKARVLVKDLHRHASEPFHWRLR